MLASKDVPYTGLGLIFLIVINLFMSVISHPMTMSIQPLGAVIKKHGINYHYYADDTQLYLYMKPDEIVQLPKIEASLQDVKPWTTNNVLLLKLR